jgi:hypothetical protein
VSKPTTKDDGQPIPDDYVSPFIKFDHHPMQVDLKDIKLKPALGYDAATGTKSRARPSMAYCSTRSTAMTSATT